MGIQNAEHEETAPSAQTLLITKLTRSLVGKTQRIKIKPESCAYQAYKQQEVIERFQCNYGLNPRFYDAVGNGPLKITGVDVEGGARIVELSDHPFYVATLFLPQTSSRPERPHPLIVGYLRAAIASKASRKTQ